MAESDWKAKFTAESRQRIVGKTMERLKRSLPFTLDASINYVAEQFEREAFNAAATKADYMRKLCMSLNSVEENAQQASKKPEISDAGVVNQNFRHQGGLPQPPNAIGHMPFIQPKMWDLVVSSKGGPWLPAPPISLFVEEPPITQASTNIDEEQVRRKMLLAEIMKALAADENYSNVLKPLVAEVEKKIKRRREVIANAEMEINKIEESKRAKS